MKRALVVVGKVPHPGSTKTRMVPPLTLEQAAALYRAFLQDTLALGRELRWECVTLVYPPLPDAERELRQVKLLELMRKNIGSEFVGVVTGITNFGIFVQIQQYLVDGLIRTPAGRARPSQRGEKR